MGVGFFSGFVYSGEGYAETLPSNDSNVAQSKLHSLQTHAWLDPGTRAVMFELNVFNPSLDSLSFVTFTFERSSTGQLQSSNAVETMPLQGAQPEFVLFVLIALLFVGSEARQILDDRDDQNYFSQFWNWYEMTLSVLFLMSIATHAFVIHHNPDVTDAINPTQFTNLYWLRTAFVLSKNALAWSMLLGALRATKYFALVPKAGPIVNATLHIFWSTDMFIFLGFYLFVLLSFSFAMLVLTGDSVATYATLASSLMAQFRAALTGDMELDELTVGELQYSGTIFFTLVILVSAIIFTNILIAIVSSEWEGGLKDGERKYWDDITRLMVKDLNNQLTHADLAGQETDCRTPETLQDAPI
mmetsp:Transcript_28190/g.61021  ORF Transcript_28190/g.61021 Transcript_28190/m.61021 type:complete len:358 (+) Transcript_28190:196-1269(+)